MLINNNNTVAIHITTQTVHIVEGYLNKGVLQIVRAFDIGNVDLCFTDDGSLINMQSLIETIANGLKANGVTAKKVHLCYDCGSNQNDRSIEFDLQIYNIGEKKVEKSGSQDIRLFKNLKTKKPISPQITKEHRWGEYVTQYESGETITTVTADKDLISSLVLSFREFGYQVVSIEPPETALFYLRHSIPFTYDSTNKIIIHADTEDSCLIYVFTKDVPSMMRRQQTSSIDGEFFQDKVANIALKEVMSGKMRNPYIYVAGKAFSNNDDYISLLETLEEQGLIPVDVLGLHDSYSKYTDSIKFTQVENDDIEIDIGGQHTVCVCMLLRPLEKNPENLADSKMSMFLMTPKNMLLAAKVAKLAAMSVMIFSAILTSIVAFEYLTVNVKLQDATTLQSNLKAAQRNKEIATLKLQTLGTIDTRLRDIFEFVYENVDSTLNIASVDTIDMLPGELSIKDNDTNIDPVTGLPIITDEQVEAAQAANESDGASGKENASTENPANGQATPNSLSEHTQKVLVIRGYSTESAGPVALYNALVEAGMGSVHLNGEEQITLPSGEQIYVFELTAGEGETLA